MALAIHGKEGRLDTSRGYKPAKTSIQYLCGLGDKSLQKILRVRRSKPSQPREKLFLGLEFDPYPCTGEHSKMYVVSASYSPSSRPFLLARPPEGQHERISAQLA